MGDEIEVKVEQVWEPADKRYGHSAAGRRFRVLAVPVVVSGVEYARVANERGPRLERLIRLDRFRPNSTGYRLVKG